MFGAHDALLRTRLEACCSPETGVVDPAALRAVAEELAAATGVSADAVEGLLRAELRVRHSHQ